MLKNRYFISLAVSLLVNGAIFASIWQLNSNKQPVDAAGASQFSPVLVDMQTLADAKHLLADESISKLVEEPIKTPNPEPETESKPESKPELKPEPSPIKEKISEPVKEPLKALRSESTPQPIKEAKPKSNAAPSVNDNQVKSAESNAAAPMINADNIPALQNGDQIDAYLSELRKRIASNMHYPKNVSRTRRQAELVIQFHLASNGQISQVKLQQSSGNNRMDKAAIEAVTQVDKFKPRPAGVDANLILPITFQLK